MSNRNILAIFILIFGFLDSLGKANNNVFQNKDFNNKIKDNSTANETSSANNEIKIAKTAFVNSNSDDDSEKQTIKVTNIIVNNIQEIKEYCFTYEDDPQTLPTIYIAFSSNVSEAQTIVFTSVAENNNISFICPVNSEQSNQTNKTCFMNTATIPTKTSKYSFNCVEGKDNEYQITNEVNFTLVFSSHFTIESTKNNLMFLEYGNELNLDISYYTTDILENEIKLYSSSNINKNNKLSDCQIVKSEISCTFSFNAFEANKLYYIYYVSGCDQKHGKFTGMIVNSLIANNYKISYMLFFILLFLLL